MEESELTQVDKIGLLADKIDDLLGALTLPMPSQFHVEQMKRELKDVSKELKEIHKELGGDPETWEEQ